MVNFSLGSMGGLKDVVEAGVGVVSWMHFSTVKKAAGTGYQLSKQQLADALGQSFVPASVVQAVLGVTTTSTGTINIGGIFNKGTLLGVAGLLALDFVGEFIPASIRSWMKPTLRGLAVGSAIGGLFDDPVDRAAMPVAADNATSGADFYTGRIAA